MNESTSGMHTPTELIELSKVDRLPNELQEMLLNYLTYDDMVKFCQQYPQTAGCQKGSPQWYKALYEHLTDYPLPPGKTHREMVDFFHSLGKYENPLSYDLQAGFGKINTYHKKRLFYYTVFLAAVPARELFLLLVCSKIRLLSNEIIQKMYDMFPNDDMLGSLASLVVEMEPLLAQWNHHFRTSTTPEQTRFITSLVSTARNASALCDSEVSAGLKVYCKFSTALYDEFVRAIKKRFIFWHRMVYTLNPFGDAYVDSYWEQMLTI